jgi:hypothetical protein
MNSGSTSGSQAPLQFMRRGSRLPRSVHLQSAECLILVHVKEVRDLLLHLSCVTRLTHGMAWFKQILLNRRGQIVSVHNYYRTDATQQMPPRQRGCSLLAFYQPCPKYGAAFPRPACFGMSAKDVRQRLSQKHESNNEPARFLKPLGR